METVLGMTIGQLLGGAAGLIVILSVFIEITPIKVNPVSGFLKWVGKRTNSELTEHVNAVDSKLMALENTIVSLQDDAERRAAVNCRVRILQFGDDIRRGLSHSKENFDQILSDIDDYEAYCLAHPDFKNNKTMLTRTKILEEYTRCMDNDDFL